MRAVASAVCIILSVLTLFGCVNAQTTGVSNHPRISATLRAQATNEIYFARPVSNAPDGESELSDTGIDATALRALSLADASLGHRADAFGARPALADDADVRVSWMADAAISPVETLLNSPIQAPSVDEYCRGAMIPGYRRRDCQQAATTLGRPACYCGQLPLSASAPAGFTGRASLQRPIAAIEGAYVMARTNNPNRPVHCDLLLRTPIGLFAFAAIETCAAPTAATSSLPSMSVRSMRATAALTGPVEFVVNWEATYANPASATGACRVSRQISCTVDAANIPSCILRQTSPTGCTTQQ